MLCRAIGAVASENDTAGFELPILRGGFKTTDCYSVERSEFNSGCDVREPILYLSVELLQRTGAGPPGICRLDLGVSFWLHSKRAC
jgi:hypothetical protein